MEEKDYTPILALGGRAFMQRSFLARYEAGEFDAEIDALPDDQADTFVACLENPRLREVLRLWWETYDAERESGNVPAVASPWLNGE